MLDGLMINIIISFIIVGAILQAVYLLLSYFAKYSKARIVFIKLIIFLPVLFMFCFLFYITAH